MLGTKAKKDYGFKSVSQSEDCEELLAGSEGSPYYTRTTKSSLRQPSWLMTAVIAIVTAMFSLSLGVFAGQNWILDPDTFSMRHISQYSPIVRDVGVTYSWLRFNGSLLKSNVFRQDAGPEVDAAWKSLGADYRAARIPSSEAASSGLAPDQVKIREEYGGGYPANVEGLHHLHCLNLLRKSLAWNFKYYQDLGMGPFSNGPEILKFHVTHCLDILRQQLMCTVDVGVLGQVWYQPRDSPLEAFVDFNTIHKCRNFDAIRDWAERHQLPDVEDTPTDFLEPPKMGDKIYHEVP